MHDTQPRLCAAESEEIMPDQTMNDDDASVSPGETWAAVTGSCGHSWRITKEMIREQTHLECPVCQDGPPGGNGWKGDSNGQS